MEVKSHRTTELTVGTAHYQGQTRSGGTWGGTWIDASGKACRVEHADVSIKSSGTWTSPISGSTYPIDWTVEVSSQETRLEVVPVMLDQELNNLLFTPKIYWEGEVNVRGTVGGTPVTGRGHVELTGYEPL
jgi:predicted secreted hydrolase